ncbi:nucleotidyl transferase AbiEii/AbiGii toxin family protein [Streptacidiphilus sp. N1-10]|uniref:Nucleotidyl transferase AbiEii/AbiGii toxin family protein n=1 Tax=Streptacidiphilus jeojiensis TaxID=3229225 RepID=A0ABV6XVE0_9ACTN
MPNPTRDSTAGRVFNDLRNLARRDGRSTQSLMLAYTLERFLFRLSQSSEGGEHFVLKGGLLLAQFGARRATQDIDLLGRCFDSDEVEVIRRINAVAGLHFDDGVLFDPAGTKTAAIRTDEEYAGLRLTMPAAIGRAQLKLQLDISFGDPITPRAQRIDYPQQFDAEPFQILGYPLETVIAEKLTTAIDLGATNTRDRDYADLYRLVCLHDFERATVRDAVERTAAHRGIELRPLSGVIRDLAARRQISYAAWRRKQEADRDAYPLLFNDVCTTVVSFADPLLDSAADLSRWDAVARRWRP